MNVSMWIILFLIFTSTDVKFIQFHERARINNCFIENAPKYSELKLIENEWATRVIDSHSVDHAFRRKPRHDTSSGYQFTG